MSDGSICPPFLFSFLCYNEQMNLLDLGYFFFLLISFPLWIRFFFKKNYRSLLRKRLSPDLEPVREKSIWIHAVSVGEVKSLQDLIRQLDGPNHPVVLSVTTPSGYHQARKTHPRLPVIPSPVDFSFVIKRFLKTVNPAILVLNELEIWPNWLSLVKKRDIPILLINGRISHSAFNHYRRYRLFLKRIFNRIDCYLVQSDLHKKRFLSLGVPEDRLEVCGNIKSDEAWALAENRPPENQILKTLKTARPRKKLVVCASTHASDEAVIFPALPVLVKRFALILVPRHPRRLPKIREKLEKQGIPHSVWSASDHIDLDTRLMVFDRIGYLFNILAISDLVVMGGTFDKKIGGHNLYEPAALGKMILGGPHLNNFPVIGQDLMEKGIYRPIENSDDLCPALERLAAMDNREAGKQAIRTVRNKRGSRECILDRIHGLIGD